MLLSVGDSVGAERALSEVVRRGGTQESTSNALIELMHCASFRRDRVGFARWRERCEAQLADMPPNIRADYYLKQGIGQARFGQFKKADGLMAQALASTNETAKSATSARMRRDMRTSENRVGMGTTLDVPSWVRPARFIRVFLRHRRAVLRHSSTVPPAA